MTKHFAKCIKRRAHSPEAEKVLSGGRSEQFPLALETLHTLKLRAFVSGAVGCGV